MKILIIRMFADVLNINNYNCQEIGLAKSLIRKGNVCDIVLFTNKKESYEEDYIFDNDKVIHIYFLTAKKMLKNCFYEKKIYQIVKKYDVVQTAEYDQIANVKLKRFCKKMIIYHGPYSSKFTWKYNIKCLFSDLYFLFHKSYKDTPCIAKSELAKEFLQKKGFNNVTTIGVGLDLDKFTSKDDRKPQIIDELYVKKNNNQYKYLLYIGKIEKRRNTIFLINLMEKIVNKDKNIKLIIVGKGDYKYKKRCLYTENQS